MTFMNKSRRQKVEHLTSVSSVVKKEELQEGLQETSFMYISNHSERKATHFLKFHLGYFFFRSTKTFTYILNNRGKLSIRQYRTTGLNSFKKLSNSFEIRDYYIIKRKKTFSEHLLNWITWLLQQSCLQSWCILCTHCYATQCYPPQE